MIPPRNRHSLAGVRRVRVAEHVCVPPGTQVNVPVKLTRSSLRTPKADWLVESKRWRPGIFSARTLLPDNAEFIAVRLVNTSSFSFRLAGSQLIGEARTAISTDSGPLRADGVRPERPQTQTGSDRIRLGRAGGARMGPYRAGACPEPADDDHLQPIRDALPDNLSHDERTAALGFIDNWTHVFSRGKFDMGRTNLIPLLL